MQAYETRLLANVTTRMLLKPDTEFLGSSYDPVDPRPLRRANFYIGRHAATAQIK